MRIEQSKWTENEGWIPKLTGKPAKAQLLMLFGGRQALERNGLIGEIRAAYPKSALVGCSTSGEICDVRVYDDSLILTAVEFDYTKVRTVRVNIGECSGSAEAGERLGHDLAGPDLTHVMVFSDGLKVNGSELVKGMLGRLPPNVQVTGGLSGDGARFEKTLVISGDALVEGCISAVGFYGKHLKIGYGSMGGWDSFGPERRITRSSENVLHELDNQPALALYKKYLGEHAAGLPSTGLLFPLNVRTEDGKRNFVRTILSVDDKAQSLTFAGDMPQGGYAQLMKANFDRLVEGAHEAARTCHQAMGSASPELAILISCVGRKLVLKQRTEEEVEAVRAVVGNRTVITGFYSYGEICPAAPNANCELHNQTMTITTLSEHA